MVNYTYVPTPNSVQFAFVNRTAYIPLILLLVKLCSFRLKY